MLYIQYYIKTVHFWLKYNGFATVRKITKLIEGGHRGFQDYMAYFYVVFFTFFYVFFWKSKKSWLFTFFCRVSYVFSNYGGDTKYHIQKFQIYWKKIIINHYASNPSDSIRVQKSTILS